MILAIVLSMVVLFGWQFFVAGPQMERAQRQAADRRRSRRPQPMPASRPPPTTTTADGTAAPAHGAPRRPRATATFADRDDGDRRDAARRRSTRPSLTGSINLTGGRLDDLQLKKYTETVDPTSPIITLLSPAGAPGGYYVEQGWAAGQRQHGQVPDATRSGSVEGDDQTLTEPTPVTLSWDNGQGLVFRRTFAVDDNYLFTVTQSVENKTARRRRALSLCRASCARARRMCSNSSSSTKARWACSARTT